MAQWRSLHEDLHAATQALDELAWELHVATYERAPGGISLMRIVLKATLAFLHYRHHPEGMTTTIKTRGLGASRSHVLSPVSWTELKPQPLSISSNSFLMK